MIKKYYEALCGFLLLLAVIVNAAEVISRIFFNVSYDLFFDFSVWLTIWALLLIGGPLLISNGHVSINFLIEKASRKTRVFLLTFNFVFTLLFGLLYTIAGILFVSNLYERQSVFPRFYPVPMWAVEICIPIGMGLFTIFSIVTFIWSIRNRQKL